MDTYGRPIDPSRLQQELNAAGIATNGIGVSDSEQQVYTFDANGVPEDLPTEARPIVDAHDASKGDRSAAFETAEDAERLRIVNERARTDPAYAALADLALGKDR